MSIATELQNLNDNILDAYTAVQGKGGTVPANKNTANLDTAIASIPSGPEAYIPREIDANGVFGQPTQSFSFSLPSGATDVSARALESAFYGCANLTSVDLSSLTNVSGMYAFQNAFYGCRNLTSVNLSSLATVSGGGAFQNAFYNCNRLTSVNLSSLAIVGGSSALQNVFQFCSNLTSVNLSSLTTARGNNALNGAFQFCTNLTSVNLSSLATVSGNGAFQNAFQYCTSLTSLSFPSLTTSSFGSRINQFDSMLAGCSGVTVHFPAAIQSTIGSWSSVTSGFGGTNTTVSFDL